MTPERLADVERLFHEALARAAADRAVFLANACGGDQALRHEVESLLAHADDASFLSTPAAMSGWDTTANGQTLIGRRIGPYEILSRIGGGGMGDVYRARDTRLPRTVAVKMPKAPYSDRFRREASAIAQLNHPHVCTLLDVGPNYLVMEYVEGPVLKGPLPVNKVTSYAGQILDALDAAHRLHIVHRDLKPDNIIVTKQGIKLLDFGLAHTESNDDGLNLTRTGDVMGTPAYMAPEQREGRQSDARADIYAFGCVLYEMLTGKRVTGGRVPAAHFGLERIVKQCLEENPDDRFQDARDVRIALEWAVAPEAGAASTTGPYRRRLAVTAAGVVMLTALSVWWVGRVARPGTDGPVLRLHVDLPEGGQFGQPVRSSSLALSPDGRTAVYASMIDGTRTLWLRRLDDPKVRQLRGTEGAMMPFWSPDGQFIAFVAGSKLRRLDVASGTVVDVCDVPQVRGGAWSPDGRILLGLLAGVVAVVPATGGSLTPLTTLNEAAGDLAHVWPQVLPGGNFLYWTPSSKAENTATIYGASIRMPNERVALVRSETRAVYATDANGIGYLLWQRDGVLMAQRFDGATLKFSGQPREIADSVGTAGGNADLWAAASSVGGLIYSAPELQQMTWFERSGKTAGTLGEPGLFFQNARFSHDGKHVAASRIDVARDLWILDVERGTSRRTTFDSLGGLAAQWSPDGRTILFMGNNTTALYRKDTSGGTPDERLASWSGNDYVLTDWSRDGRSVLNDRSTQDTRADIWVVPVTPDGHLDVNAQPRPYLRTPVNESAARFFPEPNPGWVAYQSDENGRNEIYAQAFPTPQGPHRISTNGGTRPAWGPGGKELFYQSPDNKVMVVSITSRSQTLEVSAPRELFALPPGSRFEVAPDGQRFLVTMQEQRPQPLTVIINWPALMK